MTGKKGIHWCTRQSLCYLKEKGEIVSRDLLKFNIAMLAKQGWWLFENPGSTVAKSMWEKYYHNSNFLEAPLGSNQFLVWRRLGLRWRIGSGLSILISTFSGEEAKMIVSIPLL